MTSFLAPDRLLPEVRNNLGFHLNGIKIEACDSVKWIVSHKRSSEGFVGLEDIAINPEGRAVIFGHAIIQSHHSDNCGQVIIRSGAILLRIVPRQLRKIRGIKSALNGKEMFEISTVEFIDER